MRACRYVLLGLPLWPMQNLLLTKIDITSNIVELAVKSKNNMLDIIPVTVTGGEDVAEWTTLSGRSL
jgi:hypothetical protein